MRSSSWPVIWRMRDAARTSPLRALLRRLAIIAPPIVMLASLTVSPVEGAVTSPWCIGRDSMSSAHSRAFFCALRASPEAMPPLRPASYASSGLPLNVLRLFSRPYASYASCFSVSFFFGRPSLIVAHLLSSLLRELLDALVEGAEDVVSYVSPVNPVLLFGDLGVDGVGFHLIPLEARIVADHPRGFGLVPYADGVESRVLHGLGVGLPVDDVVGIGAPVDGVLCVGSCLVDLHQ